MYFQTVARSLLEHAPRGLSTRQLIDSLGIADDLSARRELSNDLAAWVRHGRLRREPTGAWLWMTRVASEPNAPAPHPTPEDPDGERILFAARGLPKNGGALRETGSSLDDEPVPDVASLLAYYAAALRSDARGSVETLPDHHGLSWQLVSIAGAWWPEADEGGAFEIRLDALPASLREALERRGSETSLAVGWPLSIGRDRGLEMVRPAGIMAATFERSSHSLHVSLDIGHVMANPAWVKTEAGRLNWTAEALGDRLSGGARGELDLPAFSRVLREAAASAVIGELDAARTIDRLTLDRPGLHNALALFLPSGGVMTRRAARDIEAIRSWDTSDFDRTSLSPLFRPDGASSPSDLGPTLETGPLNGEQLDAVEAGLRGSLVVVTGPPGTGKSQCVTALVASVVAGGGRVLVAARNHQALDAVEARIGAAHVVRARDRDGDRDASVSSVARELVVDASAEVAVRPFETALSEMRELSRRRVEARRLAAARRRLQLDISDLLDRVEAVAPNREDRHKRDVGIWTWLRRILLRRTRRRRPDAGADLETLMAALSETRREHDRLPAPENPAELSEKIRTLGESLLPTIFNARAAIGDEARARLGELVADAELAGAADLPDEAIEIVLSARPVWLCTNLAIPKRIPLRPGLFDLVIVDEASQADIASSLPALARARRAAIVGDDRQLTFIPSVGLAQERNLLSAAGLTSRHGLGIYSQGRRSLFDLALVQSRKSADAHSVMLREQYRSAPEITELVGELFYQGALRPAVDTESLIVPDGAKPGLAWTDVRGAPERGPEGGWRNRAEAEAIVSHLADLLVRQGYPGSVGVITPFNAQAGLLKQLVAERIPAGACERASLKVDTIDSFQGEERALILLSPVVAGIGAGQASAFLAKDRRRLNVAFSRAQAVLHTFGDLEFARAARNLPDLRRLAAWATEPRRRAGDQDAGSVWESRLGAALRDRGLKPHGQYPVLGRRLDFALFKGDVKLDVEVDGRRWHLDADGRRKTDDVFRDFQLHSAGWKVLRFWVDTLDRDMETCIDDIERVLG